MKDLTRGSIPRHLITLALPMAASMIFQTLYYFVDLYFVAQLGDAAVAGVSAAGTLMFVIMAFTQVLGVGTSVLISHAAGRKDQHDANVVFNQSLLIAACCGVLTLLAGYALAGAYVRSVAADAATVAEGVSYLYWFMPGLALQFAMITMASALRGTGIVKPTMVVQIATVLINTALAPVLIAGWGTGHPLGVAGAGLASTIAVAVGVLLLWVYFVRLEKYVAFHSEHWQPRLAVWKRMAAVGLPAGGEFALLFLQMSVTYWVIRDFGAAAQAGYGIGARVMQGIFLPAMAVAFAVGPLAGQNFGARLGERVRESFHAAMMIGAGLMLLLTVLCHWRPGALIALFTHEPEVIGIGAVFLQIVSWNFVAQGIIFTCSNMFQALGNTVPALISSAARLLAYAIPAIWLSTQPGFHIEQVWYVSVASGLLQVVLSVLLLRGEMRTRLAPISVPQQA
jgi:putative MATE family efflux protein